jgi:uncharacterized protein (DUF1501 family)
MKRRDFLTISGGLAIGSGVTGWVNATAPMSSPVFLMVFLRGGADGLQLVGPCADAQYVAARPSDVRVLDSGDKAGLSLANTLAPDIDFRLHPALSPLLPLYQSGNLAVIHAVGLTNATRSHFVAQDMMERGIASEKNMSESTGWLSRALPNSLNGVSAYSATSNPVFALKGTPGYLAAPDLNAGLNLPYGDATRQLLSQWFTHRSDIGNATLDTLRVLDDFARAIPKGPDGKPLPYAPAPKATYGAAGDFGKRLGSVAQLIRADAGLKAAWIDFGGWDTHEYQSGRMTGLAGNLGAGLAAFYEDMNAANRPVVVVTLSEFGRRLRANKSNGTDHGHGGVAFVLGTGIKGGQMYGRWPGLETPQLDQGVDLAVTTDYREILSAALPLAGLQSHFKGWTGKPLALS